MKNFGTYRQVIKFNRGTEKKRLAVSKGFFCLFLFPASTALVDVVFSGGLKTA